ncbi:MAG: hypothetical protein QW683_09045 [Candidatus Caldarchaeum sp.]
MQSVLDVWTGEVHQFVWNAEGTLAWWWNSEPNSYARVFGYDEEGRLVKIERDYGNGNLQVAYEYGYTGDGVRVWKRDYLNQQEYRYLCRIGCGGVPMRVYNRAIGGTSWNTLEEYVDTPTAMWYGAGAESFSDYPLVAGHWLSNLLPPAAGQMLYLDAFGLQVGGDFSGAAVPKRVPEYLEQELELPTIYLAVQENESKDPCEIHKKCARCPQGTCGTSVEGDIATCCPDGRAYCGPASGYEVVCGKGSPPSPSPAPPKQPPFDPVKCAECITNCLLAGLGDRSFGECWEKCVEKGDCGIRLSPGLRIGFTGRSLWIGYTTTF